MDPTENKTEWLSLPAEDSSPTQHDDLERTAGEKPQSADDDTFLDEDLIGTRLDFYTIYSLLGRGAMGRVYRAWNERLQRLCAVKIISPGLARAEPERLEMFLQEARTAAQLVHPNVVTIHTLGNDRGFHFIEMEFMGGPSLAQHLKNAERLEPLVATRFVFQIASGLAVAHRQGLLHCDVKPDNVLLTVDGVAKLGDFGLAKAFGRGEGRQQVGTPFYMAPELFLGREASFASDVYALGTTYFGLLTGQLPYPSQSLRELQEDLLFSEVPKPSDLCNEVPGAMCCLVRQMMHKDPAQRPKLDASLLNLLSQMATELVPMKELVEEACAGRPVEWRQDDAERFLFDVRLPGGRHQTVIGEEDVAEHTGDPVVSFWTPCAPATPDHYGYVLQLNARLPFGAVGVRPYEGQDYFVMTSNHPRSTLDPEEIRATVVNMAEWADLIEHKLTGKDLH